MGKKIKEGQTENKDYMRCNQIQCSYYLQGGCKNCDECHTDPYEIKKSCSRCISCMTNPNELRFSDDNIKKQQEEVREQIRQMAEEFKKNVQVIDKGNGHKIVIMKPIENEDVRR